MGLKFRRGSTAQQSGSLAFGEPYVNTTLGTLVVGGAAGDIILSATGTGSTGNFGAISGSGLDITGNANIAGNLTLGGTITIGDASADTINVVASLSSSLIPATTNAFDLGSASKIWRDLYISTGSIKFVDGTTVVSTLDLAKLSALEAATGSANSAIAALNSYTASNNTTNTTQNSRLDQLSTASGSATTRLTALEVETSNLETFSGSSLTRLTALEVETTNLESFTSSINTTIKNKLNADGVISGSSQILGGSGLISGSSQITISDTTGYTAFSSSLNSRISTEKGRVDAILLAADADKDSFAEIVTLINSVDTTNDTTFASFYTASVGRLNNLESTSGSVNVSVSNLNTYTGSNDTTNGTQNTRLTALEASASTALSTNGTQATSITNLNSFSSSALTRLSALEVETANLETTSASVNISVTNLNSFSSSTLTRLTNLEGKDISVTLTGDVTGTGTITDLGNVSFATTIAANSVALGTDTTGNYMSDLTQGTGVTITHTPGEGSNATIAIGQVVATSSDVRFNSLGIGMAASATAGRIDATNDIVAFSSSDIRFKENITPIENALDKISKISGNTYDWKAENKAEHGYEGNDVGVIAQEIEAVLPQLVQTRENGYKAVKYDKLVALLIEGIKEQQLQIEELKAQIGSK